MTDLIKNAKLTSVHFRKFDIATANLIEAMTEELERQNGKLEALARAVINDQTSHDQPRSNKQKERLADLILKAFHDWDEDNL